MKAKMTSASIAMVLLALGVQAEQGEEACLSVSSVNYSTETEESEVAWEAVVDNDCGPEITVMLNVTAFDGSPSKKRLYWANTVETIEQRGRKFVQGSFFAPAYVLSNLEDIEVTVGQVSRAY